jgi:hypothetical protein
MKKIETGKKLAKANFYTLYDAEPGSGAVHVFRPMRSRSLVAVLV